MTYIDASEALAVKALTWPDRAAGLSIISQETYELAGSYLVGIKELRAEVEAHHRPIIASAYETHKRAVAALRSIDDPLAKAEAIIKPKVAAYDAEQRRLAEEARRAAEAEQERLQAEWVEQRIERAEAAGATPAEVRAIIEQPMIVPQVRAVSNHQPVQGVSVRERYVVKVVNIRALCRAIADSLASTELVLPNLPALKQDGIGDADHVRGARLPGGSRRLSSSTEVRTMESNEMVPVETGATEIRMSRHPETVLAEATLCAKALVKVVKQTNAVARFAGREFLQFTAWQTLATMFRITTRVREMRFVDFDGVKGWECTADAFHIPSGQVVASAEAQCTNDEPNWSVRPKYEYRDGKKVLVGQEPVPMFQLRSMAQTRACAKALRLVLSWVVVLAGYEPVAAEEMTDDEGGHAPALAQPQRKSAAAPVAPAGQAQTNGGWTDRPAAGGGTVISEKQASRIWGIAHGANKSKDDVIAIIKSFGFATAKDVTTDRYEALCDAVGKSDAAE